MINRGTSSSRRRRTRLTERSLLAIDVTTSIVPSRPKMISYYDSMRRLKLHYGYKSARSRVENESRRIAAAAHASCRGVIIVIYFKTNSVNGSYKTFIIMRVAVTRTDEKQKKLRTTTHSRNVPTPVKSTRTFLPSSPRFDRS